jgi:hypothetical protein
MRFSRLASSLETCPAFGFIWTQVSSELLPSSSFQVFGFDPEIVPVRISRIYRWMISWSNA